MDFHSVEETDGIRFSWNVWPSSRLEATRVVVPFGAMYTPLKRIENLPVLNYEPVMCKGNACHAVLNPFCRNDFRGKIWICPFCYQRNHYPAHYADISENNLPAELIPNYTTIEYELPRSAAGPPVFLFVVDTNLSDDELQALKDSLTMSLQLLPPNSLVGLITFGTTVQVHELGFTDCSKSYVFRGTKEVSAQQVQDLLGIGIVQGQRIGGSVAGAGPGTGASRFLQEIQECDFTLTTILEELQKDPWPVQADHRPLRCTGVAVSVAVGLLETTYPNSGARIMVFTGGPCTSGPGQCVGPELNEPIRSHHDLEKGTAKHYQKALKFYQGLSKRTVQNGHVVDVFACSMDQVGVYEMKPVIETTGGYLILAEGFGTPVFKETFRKIFHRDGNITMAFEGTLEVTTSREYKVCGAIGPCASLNKKSPCVAETELGLGGTSAWKLSALDSNTTIALYFEVTNQHSTPIPAGQQRYLQIATQYQHTSGKYRLRVTTLAGPWTDGSNLLDIGNGFDQEAAAVLMARVAVYKTETEEAFDILRWLDRMLIRLVSKFAEYSKDDSMTFRLSPSFSIYPQFMFHLRRSQFLQVFNQSPDETTFFRLTLNRENVTNSLIMIQPTLFSYSFSGPPVPVLLDVTSVAPDRILLLDTFFFVIIFHGDTISTWRKQRYQDDPKHAHFKQLLEAPKEEASAIIKDRFPVPRLVECDQYGSQARFLLSKLNPSVTHNTSVNVNGATDKIFTDDVSLQVFMDHLKRLAVSQQ
mmetsp:Transcript_26598/g.44462  ORF Transcript_26598/g.44462 Transcript_26598/m.44462 type:complete len:757 (+) Transcript_26598:112-2382(+)